MEHAEAKSATGNGSPSSSDAIRMEHAEAKVDKQERDMDLDDAIRMEHAEAKDQWEYVATILAQCNPHGAR